MPLEHNPLTVREWQILRLVAEGRTNREVAAVVGHTEHVVKNYIRTIYDKLGLWNRLELALWYVSRSPQEKARAACRGRS